MASSRTFASRLGTFWGSPTGPKTTYFWGPAANWGFVLAVGKDELMNVTRFQLKVLNRINGLQGVADTQKDASLLSPNMTGGMGDSGFMRFALAFRPRNYLLFACHAANETVQQYNLQRWQRHAKGWSVSDRVSIQSIK